MKLKRIPQLLSALAVAAVLAGWAAVRAEDKNQPGHAHEHGDHADYGKPADASKANPRCPVSGDKIDREAYLDTDLGRVYFCCKHCIKDYQADPKKFAEAVHAQQALMGPPRVQVACPVSGKPIDRSAWIDHYGQKIYFCCKNCPKKFQDEPKKYLDKFSTAFTIQANCPISGKPIDPAVSTKLADDGRVYFCCPKCVSPFEGERTKYGAKLPAFFVCPMTECKDIGALHAGSCPKCGMAREAIGTLAKADKAAPKSGGHDHAGHEH